MMEQQSFASLDYAAKKRKARKGKQWHFGMDVHVGVDVNSGTAHTVAATAANEADTSQLPDLPGEGDGVVFGGAGYASVSGKRGPRAPRFTLEGQRQAQAGQREPGAQAA